MLRTLLATAVSLVAFAANSLLARAALGERLIDPVSFTAVRLASGAAGLWLVSRLLRGSRSAVDSGGSGVFGVFGVFGSWPSAVALFVYAIAFSWAYLSLSAGTGALVLFGAVQVTMIAAGLLAGERPGPLRWLGLAAAVGGLVYLLSPGLSAPDPLGAALMAAAGVAWGAYSLRGRTDPWPVGATTGNFLRTVPLTLVVLVPTLGSLEVSRSGLILALVSGVVTSGLGYVVWYAALRNLTATLAAVVQLTVPILAALGGVLLLSEVFSARLAIASVLILGGVAIATMARES